MNTLKLVCFLLFLAILPMSSFGLIMPPMGGKPDSAKECAICHLPWLSEVKNETSDLLLGLFERRYVTEMMCYSCHDGSTTDSRFSVWETLGHRSGIKPTNSVSIPDDFPLDDEGALICATCHSAHRIDSEKDIGVTIFMRQHNTDSALCMTCHSNEDGGLQQGKHPIGIVLEEVPEAIIKAGGKMGTNNTIICETCHASHGSVNEYSLVLPSSESGIANSALCEACHTDSPSLATEQALKRHSHPVNATLPDDAALPDLWDNGEVPRLGKGKSVNCRACHSPHNGTKNNHLLVSKDSGDRLCVTCHSSKKRIYKSKHDIARYYPDNKNIMGEKASEKGTCRACHFMHRGSGPKMWAREMTAPGIARICSSCHAQGKIAKNALTGKFSHPMNIKQREGQGAGLLPLFTDQGKKDPQGKVVCASCHDVHNWDPATDKSPEQWDKEGTRYTSFLRAPYDDWAMLCANCHKENVLIVGTDHDLQVTAQAEQNINQETTEQAGVCSACHLVHKAKAKGLWARETEPSDNQNETLCKSCHAGRKVASNKVLHGPSHPMGKRVIDARATLKNEAYHFYEKVTDGEASQTALPLFSKKGNKSINGVITCSTCHNVHRWNPVRRIAGGGQNIEGDGGSSFLRKATLTDSGLCTTCHTQKALVTNTGHDLSTTAPQERNMLGKNVAQSGVCSACHIVHGAREDSYLLWARYPNDENDLRQEQLCLSCHAIGTDVTSKTVKHYSHPEDAPVVQLARPGQPDYAPVYDKEGRKVRSGIISCPTCHDPHISSADTGRSRVGRVVRGKKGKNFLRIKSAKNPCKDCHGLESLRKYTYFHKNPRKIK